MADTTASAILNKHLGSRAARAEESARRLPPHSSHPQEPSPAQSGSGVSPLGPNPALCKSPAPQMAFAAPIILPQGDGSVKVMPGKPVPWLTVAQVASHFGLSPSTIYRCIDDGTLPPELVQKPGKRNLRINAAALGHLETTWRSRRDAA